VLRARNQSVYDAIKDEFNRRATTLVLTDHLTPQ
jgi:hypothetical protein